MKKKIAVCIFTLIVAIVFIGLMQSSTKAKGDSVLEEIAKYKNWAKVNKEDEKIANRTFRITDSSVAG